MTAAEKMLEKELVASGLNSREWEIVQAGLRDRAFFSSRVESVRFLQEARDRLVDLLSSARNEDGALTSRAQLVSDFMRSARDQGIATGKGGLTDPGSAPRAKVIVDTNAGLARGYAGFVAGSTKGARMAYPAQELVRLEERRQPRDWASRFKAAGGELRGGRMVALKDDSVWARLSRFGTPYPPFDYDSGMGLDDVSFEECVSLGLLQEDWVPEDPGPVEKFNATLEADLSVSGEDDPAWRWLKDSFGAQIERADGKVRWVGR